MQVSVRLLDMAKSSQLVWSDRFDVSTDELDELNERIVGPVVARSIRQFLAEAQKAHSFTRTGDR